METPGLLQGCLAARIERAPEAFSGSVGVRTDNSVAVAGGGGGGGDDAGGAAGGR